MTLSLVGGSDKWYYLEHNMRTMATIHLSLAKLKQMPSNLIQLSTNAQSAQVAWTMRACWWIYCQPGKV